MITVQIGSSGERTIEEASESWINEQINRRREDRHTVCVRVRITEPPVDMILATPGCGGGGSGGRSPNQQERRVFELWVDRHLNEAAFTGGNLIAFLRQLEKIL